MRATWAIILASLLTLYSCWSWASDRNGAGNEVLLQGFHWASHEGVVEGAEKKSWYQTLEDNAGTIKGAGIDGVWFPPSSDAADDQGYLPRRWYDFNSRYGTEAELRKAINRLAPTRAIADIVINHRVGAKTPRDDFESPSFPNNAAAITKDDECGCGLGGNDERDSLPYARDLDHSNPDVRATVKVYLSKLQSLGFGGWRYDVAKGYAAKHFGEYNAATNAPISVGEYFSDSNDELGRWIAESAGSTGSRSMAFDFSTRAILLKAIQSGDFSSLKTAEGKPAGVIGFFPDLAVTFLDNHDTEWRRWRAYVPTYFEGDNVIRGYAYILTHPGMPCVFWSHLFDWDKATGDKIRKLIKIRKQAGLTSRSVVDIREARQGLYAAFSGNLENGNFRSVVAVKLGSDSWAPGAGWRISVHGNDFAVWVRD